MGCDIHVYVERRVDGRWECLPRAPYVDHHQAPFGDRSYSAFGFLAGVRNYAAVPLIAAPRGIPEDASAEAMEEYRDMDGDAHTPSWLSVAELQAFDYDANVEDRRVMRDNDGGRTCAPGEGRTMTWREFLGDEFMDDLRWLREAGAERIVFWFDN